MFYTHPINKHQSFSLQKQQNNTQLPSIHSEHPNKKQSVAQKIQLKAIEEITKTNENCQTKGGIQQNQPHYSQRYYKMTRDSQGKRVEKLNKLGIKLITKKNSIVSLSQNNIVDGSFGHNTVIFNPPLSEGSFYIQFKILNSQIPLNLISYPPSVRIGICNSLYNLSRSLGGINSIGWKSIDGKLIGNQDATEFQQKFGEGDIIGVEAKVEPPHKNKQITFGELTWWKNKKKVISVKFTSKSDWCFAISLYNYARVQVIQGIVQYSQCQDMPNKKTCKKLQSKSIQQ